VPPRTNEFQRLIAVIQSHLDPGSTVTESAMLTDLHTGAKREVDVVVGGRVGHQAVTVSIECRDRSRRDDVGWVEQMHGKHSRLPTNVLVLVSHSDFTPEAKRVALGCGIRCLVLDDVDPTAPDRLFPEVRSLWGKAYEITTIERVEITVGAVGPAPPEHFQAYPNTQLLLDDGSGFGSAAEFANSLFRAEQVVQTMTTDAGPEHGYVELDVRDPTAQGRQICVQKVDPPSPVLRPVERFRVVAKCRVTVDEFPLRHGLFENVRVAWATGALLGRPAMLVATSESGQETRFSVRFSQSTPGDTQKGDGQAAR
jgi:hypothetical protein